MYEKGMWLGRPDLWNVWAIHTYYRVGHTPGRCPGHRLIVFARVLGEIFVYDG